MVIQRVDFNINASTDANRPQRCEAKFVFDAPQAMEVDVAQQIEDAPITKKLRELGFVVGTDEQAKRVWSFSHSDNERFISSVTMQIYPQIPGHKLTTQDVMKIVQFTEKARAVA